MIDVSLLSVMRRWYFREGMSQREIARRTGLSRNTVRRYLNNDITEPVYPKRQALSKIIAYITDIAVIQKILNHLDKIAGVLNHPVATELPHLRAPPKGISHQTQFNWKT